MGCAFPVSGNEFAIFSELRIFWSKEVLGPQESSPGIRFFYKNILDQQSFL
jgi:hypothetical protein